MDILINQPFGIGDILFSEPIARYYHNLGKKILWPVIDEYIWIKAHLWYISGWIQIPKWSRFHGLHLAKCLGSLSTWFLPVRHKIIRLRGLTLYQDK